LGSIGFIRLKGETIVTASKKESALTLEHVNQVLELRLPESAFYAVVPLELLKIYNERIDKANAEQSAEQYITAAQSELLKDDAAFLERFKANLLAIPKR
jgi:hypothetical protein